MSENSKIKDGVLFDETGTVLIKYPEDLKAEEYVLPPEVVEIKGSAFWGHRYIKRVICNEGLKSIGDNAFGYSTISSIVLPSTLERIEDCAFKETMIRELFIPSVPKELGSNILKRDKFCTHPPKIKIVLGGLPEDWRLFDGYFSDPYNDFIVEYTAYDSSVE